MIIMSLGKKDLRSLKLAFEQLLFTAMQFFVWFGKEFQRVEAATANERPPLVFKLNACFQKDSDYRNIVPNG